jgi:hypothetical protein
VIVPRAAERGKVHEGRGGGGAPVREAPVPRGLAFATHSGSPLLGGFRESAERPRHPTYPLARRAVCRGHPRLVPTAHEDAGTTAIAIFPRTPLLGVSNWAWASGMSARG